MSIRNAKRLADRAAYLQSLIHRDSASFDRDHRIGAVLLDPTGAKIAERIAQPVELAGHVSIGARSVGPWMTELPADHPRLGESRSTARAVLRDLLDVEHDRPTGYAQIP
jgi:hypothetical protein